MRAHSGRRRPRPTIADVAASAGVSRATAARALGEYGYVHEETRAAVRSAAEKLGYRSNGIARSMVTGRTQTIAFVSADMGNPFFAQTMIGITTVARAHGYEVVISDTQEDPELERRALLVLHERQIDGLIVVPAQFVEGDHIRQLLDHGIPVVLLDRSVRDVPADSVLIDNVSAARSGVDRLVALGHRRIGLVTNDLTGDLVERLEAAAVDPIHASTGASRGVGYLTSLRRHGIAVDPELIQAASYTRESAAKATRALLGLPDPPTAILTVDNVLSLGAFEEIQASGIPFPQEISLLGFDDLEWTTIVRPTLSVIAQPAYDIGSNAARRLFTRLDGDETPPQTVFLHAQLIERESLAPAPAETRGRLVKGRP